MTIEFVQDATRLIEVILAIAKPYDLFVIDIGQQMAPQEIADAVRRTMPSLPASVWVVGPTSEATHDLLDDVLLEEGSSSEITTVTAWVDKEAEMSLHEVSRTVRWMSTTGHAVVWVPDPHMRAEIEAAVDDAEQSHS